MQVAAPCLAGAAQLQQHALSGAHTGFMQPCSQTNLLKTTACCAAAGPLQLLPFNIDGRSTTQHVLSFQEHQLGQQLFLTQQLQPLTLMAKFSGWQAASPASSQHQHSTASLEAWLRQLQTNVQGRGKTICSSTGQALTAAPGSLQQWQHRWCCCGKAEVESELHDTGSSRCCCQQEPARC